MISSYTILNVFVDDYLIMQIREALIFRVFMFYMKPRVLLQFDLNKHEKNLPMRSWFVQVVSTVHSVFSTMFLYSPGINEIVVDCGPVAKENDANGKVLQTLKFAV